MTSRTSQYCLVPSSPSSEPRALASASSPRGFVFSRQTWSHLVSKLVYAAAFTFIPGRGCPWLCYNLFIPQFLVDRLSSYQLGAPLKSCSPSSSVGYVYFAPAPGISVCLFRFTSHLSYRFTLGFCILTMPHTIYPLRLSVSMPLI